jgi:hypothetical protein
MTILPDLERDLIDAAGREATASHVTGRPVRRGNRGGMLAIALSAGVALAVAAVILVAGHGQSDGHRAARTTAVPGRQQLIDMLGVLRRPQNHGDLHSFFIARLLQRYRQGEGGFFGRTGTPDIPLIRRAATTPWGTGIFLIPVEPPTAAQRARLPAPARRWVAMRDQEGIMLFVDSGGGCCDTAASVEAGLGAQTDGAGRNFAGGSTQTRLIKIVPDGVVKVEFLLPRQPNPYGPPGTAPIYGRVLRITVPVHHNTVAVQIPRQCCAGNFAEIWYAADGRVINRIGNFAKLNRVVPPIKPAPPTAQSRAALKNPATPNRVTVTPAVGPPSTNFSVHFRVLISDADYRFHVTGPPCRYTFQGGQGGGPSDTRGRIYSARLGAIEGQRLCPGTYTVSVSLMDLGAAGNLKHLPGPFGSASFTVR